MFGPKELDLKNIYNPDLQNIQESAERTYGEANSFYRKEELYLKHIENRILSGELSSEKDIYDECHAIASDLAKCCEMYLKALYIYEHNIPGNQIDELWEKLKNSEFKTDEKGNLIYITPAGEFTFVKYDSDGNPIKDADGKIIYFDRNNNTYNENTRGSKIKRNGHQLDRLIELLSPESSLLLEKGVLTQENQITSEQYVGWIEQHKKTFEEARYSGQKKSDVSIEFLYHLATQIKAVVQYRIDPKNNQKFTLTDEELSQLPSEIRQMVSFHSNLMSEELIKLIANNEEIKNKIIFFFSNKYVLPTKDVTPLNFYNMIKLMDYKEITYISYLCYMIQNYNKLKDGFLNGDSEEIKELYEIARKYKFVDFGPNKLIGIFGQIKEKYGSSISINNKIAKELLQILIQNKFNKNIIKPIYYNKELNYNIFKYKKWY